MPFKDTNEGTTHSYNDACGMPEHNDPEKEEWCKHANFSHCLPCDLEKEPPMQPKQNWEEEFDEKFPSHGFNNLPEDEFHGQLIKHFISSLLQTQAQEIEEKVRMAYKKGYMDAQQSLADED